MRQPLSPDEQRGVEDLVRRKGERCSICGSAVLRCDDTAAALLSGGYSVRLICTNAETRAHAGGIGLVRDYSITPDEARQIGLG